MFLKKSLFFTTALALLMFAGQASAQLSLSLGDGGSATVTGAGTEITVNVSQMGVTASVNAIQVVFDIDTSVLTLTGASADGFIALPVVDGNTASLVPASIFAGNPDPVPVPASASFTFTTATDVTGVEFSIGVSSISLDGNALPVPPPAALMFNGGGDGGDNGDGDTGMPPTDGNGDTGMPPTDGDMIASLTSDGATIVRGIGASAEVVVDVAVSGMEESFGAEIVFAVDPPVATITVVNKPEGILISNTEGMKVTHVGLPPAERGDYGSVTFTTGADYDGTKFTVSIASFNAFESDAEDQKMSVAGGAPLVVNKPLPTLTPSQEGDVMIMPGGEASVMVTAAGFDGDVTLDGAAEDGTVTASAPGEVTVTATDGIDPETASVTINFVWGPLTASATEADPVPPGGSSSVTLTASGQAEGAEVTFASDNEAVAIDGATATASGAATAMVTATVGDVTSDPVEVSFAWGALTLEGPAEVTIGPDGGVATLTASGQADGAEVAITSDNDAVTVDGNTASASSAATATLTATVGDAPPSNSVTIKFVPSLQTEMAEVVIPRGESATAMFTTVGFPEGANIKFTVTASTDVESSDDGSTLTVTSGTPGDVTVVATDGTDTTAPSTVTFVPTPPELVSDAADDTATIPVGGSVSVVVTALDFADGVFQTDVNSRTDTEGVATVDTKRDGATLTLTASGIGGAVATVTANDGTNTASIDIAFAPAELTLMSSADEPVMVPVDGSGSATVTASGQANDDDVVFALAEEVEGVTLASEGATATLTATGAATATVMASVGDVTATATVEFVDGALQLVSSASEAVMVQPGGSGSATVTLMNLAEGEEFSFSIDPAELGTVDGNVVTLSASGAATASVTAMVNGLTTGSVTVEFVQAPLMLSSDAEAAVTVLPGGSGMVTLTASGQAEGATVTFALGEGAEGVALTDNEDGTATVSASGAGMGTVTASVGDVASNAVDVAFEQAPLMLSSDAEAAVTVLPGGSGMVTLTASGQAEGATVTFALGEGAEGVALTDNEDGTATVSASGAGMGTVTASVGDVASNAVDVAFEQAPLMLSSDAEAAVTVFPGGSGMVTLTASGQAEGATVTFALGEGAEGVALTDNEDGTATVSASGAGMGTVTASVGDVASNAVDVAFEQAPLMLAGDTTAEISYGGSGSAMLTASGQAEGATVTFNVEGEGVTATEEGATVTLSASAPTTAMVTAAVGDVMSSTVEVAFVDALPELRTEMHIVEFPYGGAGEASVMAVGFAEDAQIQFEITGGTLNATDDHAVWTVTTTMPGDVMLRATDGMVWTDMLTITFRNPDPYLVADDMDTVIPAGGSVAVTVTAIGLDANNTTFTFTERSGTAKVDLEITGAQAVLTGSGEGSASVTLIASDGTFTTASITITFRKMPEVTTEMADVEVPQAVAPNGTSMVVAVGFPPDAEITFNVEVTSGLESYLAEPVWDGNVLTLTATGSVTVSVTASGGGVTTSAVEVAFEQALPAAPASVVVQDQAGDNGYYVMVSFANSANHADVSQYRVYREMMVNTTLDDDGNVVATDKPVATWVAWAVVDAMDNDDEEGMTRAVVPVTDATATRWGVAAEKGMSSAEITPAGKRVFSKESVQLMAQFLGLDPNLMVSQDELSEMFMPSADYINSIIGGRENVVFAALDPDLSVLVGDVSVPQNIRTDGYGPIVSSPIVATDGIVAALDDTAPAAVTDVAADAETGMVTWTMSADDMIVGMINYRGYAMPIPGVAGYKVMAGASAESMIDVTALVVPGGILPAGSTSLQVPQAFIETLINQSLPAVLVTVVAMDGTNMTPSVPLVVELIPTRKAFVDADGGSVYIVDLNDGNLTVGFEDFVAFTMAFNTDETHENWRVFVQADLNDDKTVNFDDFILFFSSYGKEAQGPAGKSLVTPVLGVNEIAEFSLRLGNDRVVVGENMFVDVSLTNVQALMGYGFVLHYDAEKFEFVEAVPAAEDLLKSAGGETPLFRGWSEEAGQVHVMNAIVNGSEVFGDGDVVRLVFRVLRDFEDNARFEIADGLVFDPNQFANPLVGGVLDIQTTPTEFALLQNFPNPFNPETTIGYELAESADVTLQIYNVVGQVVRTLMAAEPQSVGRYQVRWDGIDDRGTPVSSGIYFYQISAGKFQDVRKLMLLK